MDGVTVSVLGALVALAIAIILILKKVQPTYAMIFGAIIGGLVGGAVHGGTVYYNVFGTSNASYLPSSGLSPLVFWPVP